MQNESETTLIKSLLAFVCSIAVVITLIGSTIHFIKRNDANEQTAIMKSPGYTVGLITAVRTYKGRGVTVEYKVRNKECVLTTGVTSNFLRTHQKGDTTAIIYLKTDPSIAILKADLNPALISNN
jgi:hypothetical protein